MCFRFSSQVSFNEPRPRFRESRNRTSRRLKLFILGCGVILVISVTLIIHFYKHHKRIINISEGTYGLAQLRLLDGTLEFFDQKHFSRLTIRLGNENFPLLKYEDSVTCHPSHAGGVCLNWPSLEVTLMVYPNYGSNIKSDFISCYTVSWIYTSKNTPSDCILLDSVIDGLKHYEHIWFDTQSYILWPKVKSSTPIAHDPCMKKCQKYVPGGLHSDTMIPYKNVGGTIVEPLWLSSNGVLIRSSLDNLLIACTNLCFNNTVSDFCLRTISEESLEGMNPSSHNLTYTVCIGDQTVDLYKEIIPMLIKPQPESGNLFVNHSANRVQDVSLDIWPRGKNCSALMEKPFWNIVFSDDKYNPESIEHELKSLEEFGGTLYLSNMTKIYTHIGDFSLRHDLEMNITDFLTVARKMDFEVIFPVSPFVNYDSDSFSYCVQEEMLIKNEEGSAPALTNISQLGASVFPGIVDFTNPKAAEWFVNQIISFQDKHEASYIGLFYGQTTWLPSHYNVFRRYDTPSFFSTLYTSMAYKMDSCTVTDVAFSSQNANQLVMLNAVADLEKTVQVALASGIAGYPFFIPNLPSHLEEGASVLNTEELEEGFILWIHLVTFFPVVHIPWDFSILKQHGVNITKLMEAIKRCMDIRNGPSVGSAIKSAMFDAMTGGFLPIIKPIWMTTNIRLITNSRFRKKIYSIQDQFMIGNNYMFAPVLEIGQRERSVYFPPGNWKKLLSDDVIHANVSLNGHWLTSYKTSLFEPLIFERIQS